MRVYQRDDLLGCKRGRVTNTTVSTNATNQKNSTRERLFLPAVSRPWTQAVVGEVPASFYHCGKKGGTGCSFDQGV